MTTRAYAISGVESKNRATVVRHIGNGFQLVSGRLTRPGIFHYAVDDGSNLAAYRPMREVASDSYLATVRGSALMVDHPAKKLIGPGDSLDGLISVATVDSQGVNFEGWVTSQEGIAALDSGMNQLSAGFLCDWILMTGPEVQQAIAEYPIDAATMPANSRWVRQENLRNNHGAIVDWGRAGRTCALDGKTQTLGALEPCGFFIPLEEAMTIKTAPALDDATTMASGMTGGMVSQAVMPATATSSAAEPTDTPEEEAAEEAAESAALAAIAGNAIEIATLAMSLAMDSAAHGITLDVATVIREPQKAAQTVISHFITGTLPVALDSAAQRLALASILLKQAPRTAAALDSAAEDVEDAVVLPSNGVALDGGTALPQQADTQTELQRLWAAIKRV